MAQVFNNTLRNVCGLNAAAANAIIAQGFTAPADFIPLEESDIDHLVKHTLKANVGAVPPVAIPYLSVVKIKAFRYWAILYDRIGLLANPVLFDDAELAFVQDLMKERRDRKTAQEATPEKPPELKDLGSWRTFWEKFDTYLSQIFGAAEIPLTYVYREHVEVTQDMRQADYVSNDERYFNITVLEGSHFREDNKRVYEELKTTLIDGPGWSFIRRFDQSKNGRAAVLAIKTQAEGRAAEDTRKQRAYAMIATARYAGPRRNWTFQSYVQRHQEAHNELLILQEPIPETKKVTDFLAGITDSRLANAKDIILGNAEYLHSFEQCQQYLATLVGNKAEQAKIDRQISQVQASSTSSRNRSDGKTKDKAKQPKIHAGNYTNQEWRDLGDDGRAKVRALREKAKAKRKLSEVSTSGDIQEEDKPDDSNMEQFGRAAHKRNKKSS